MSTKLKVLTLLVGIAATQAVLSSQALADTTLAAKLAEAVVREGDVDLLEPNTDQKLAPKKEKEKRGSVSDFYSERGEGVLSIYSDQLQMTTKPEVGYFPEREKEEKAKKEESQPIEAVDIIANLLKEAIAKITNDKSLANSRISEAPKTREDILAQYGDPTERTPVYGVKDAPKPYQAMMAAAEAGDEELLRAYTKQYVMYLKGVQERTATVMQNVNQAMAEEKMLPGQKPGTTQAGDVVVMQEEQIDEAKIRKEIRDVIKGQPVDPYGEVDVYVFIKTDSKNSDQMLPELDVFEKSIKKDPKVRMAVLAIDNPSQAVLDEYKKKNNIKFNILPGAELAKQVGIKGVPSTVFATHNSKKMVMEQGYRRYFFLDEYVRHMQGKPVGTVQKK